MGSEKITSERIYPIGSYEGMQHCKEHMTRSIRASSSDRHPIKNYYNESWFRYNLNDFAERPSYESLNKFGFKRHRGDLYYHQDYVKVPYRTEEQAYYHCNKYY